LEEYEVIWTSQAKQDLKNIFEYWKKKSVQGAKNVRSDILQSPKPFIMQNIIRLTT